MKINENNKEPKRVISEEGADNFTGGFSVPENYFEKLESSIEEKVNRIPILYTTKSENPFAVPAKYFSELENSVREKVSLATERTASRPFYLRPRLVPVMALVLVLVLSTAMFVLLNRQGHSVSEKDISFTDIYNSVYISDLDESALAELIEMPADSNSNILPFENYIIEDNTDIYSLTEEL